MLLPSLMSAINAAPLCTMTTTGDLASPYMLVLNAETDCILVILGTGATGMFLAPQSKAWQPKFSTTRGLTWVFPDDMRGSEQLPLFPYNASIASHRTS